MPVALTQNLAAGVPADIIVAFRREYRGLESLRQPFVGPGDLPEDDINCYFTNKGINVKR